MNHRQIQIHKTHHGSDLGEATSFTLIIYYVLLHEAHIQMAFCPRTPKWSFEILIPGTLATLQAHNFTCKPPIEMKSKEKL
jgi:hypothetical protein